LDEEPVAEPAEARQADDAMTTPQSRPGGGISTGMLVGALALVLVLVLGAAVAWAVRSSNSSSEP
jgi:hypothetical protein